MKRFNHFVNHFVTPINDYRIGDNDLLFDDRINQISNHFIIRIDNIADAISANGITATKPLVLSAIKNPESIDCKNDEIRNALNKACKLMTKCDYRFFNGLTLSDPAIMDWFDIDNDGHAFIPDAVREQIEYESGIFIRTAAGKELRDLQCAIAAKLEKMHYIMRTLNNARSNHLRADVANILVNDFPNGLFEYKDENGFMRITPRALNFDPCNTKRKTKRTSIIIDRNCLNAINEHMLNGDESFVLYFKFNNGNAIIDEPKTFK